MKSHRKAAVAGSFYSADPEILQADISQYLALSTLQAKEPVKFLIVPHAGYMYSGKIAGEAFAEVVKGNYRRVILLGPSHHFYFEGIVESDASFWETPLGPASIERLDHPEVDIRRDFHDPEHSLEVEIPFLKYLLPHVTFTPLLLAGPHSQAAVIADLLLQYNRDDTLWVISSDFSHVGPAFGYLPSQAGYESGVELDHKASQVIEQGKVKSFSSFLEQTQATICGALPILVAMHMRKELGCPHFQLKNYDCSGRQTGHHNSVGYAALFC